MTSWTEILKANKGLHARDSFSELWGLKLKAARAEFPDYTITGTLPLSFNSRAAIALKNYRIHGTSAGAGVETENLIESIEQGTWSTTGFVKTDSDTRCRIGNIIDVITEQSYTIHCETSGSTQGLVNIQYKNDSGTSISESGWQNFGTSGNYTVTIPSGATKITIILTISPGNVNCSPLDFLNIMFVSGSTAPTSYIPYGYKIPILNTSGVTENVLIDKPYKTGYYITADGQEYAIDGFNIYATETLDTSLGEYSFYFKVYQPNTNVRVHGYSNGVWQQQITTFSNIRSITITKPQGIDEIRISCAVGYSGRTLIEGSTPPDHYIPHRYESNYDLFIGDTKLGEEEYADYGEQKVYKRTENILNCNTFSAGYLDSNGNVANVGDTSSVEATYDSVTFATTEAWRGVHTEKIEIPQEASSLYFQYTGATNNNQWRFAFYDVNDNKLSVSTLSGANDTTLTIPQDASSIAVGIQLSSATTYTFTRISLYNASHGTGFIPYLQPTDPPVPLPAINTYKGENTLSSTETVGEVSITGKITEMT